jgi:hypothetical protein
MMRQRNPDDPRYKIDITKKVFVYKNLHQDCWSIKQGGLVKVHTTELNLWMCEFKVNRNGRERVRREKRKNVHAGVKGYMGESTWDTYPEELFDEVTYNPYKYKSFVMKGTEAPRWFANQVRLQPNKVLVTPS